jgi:hypothetical protein
MTQAILIILFRLAASALAAKVILLLLHPLVAQAADALQLLARTI